MCPIEAFNISSGCLILWKVVSLQLHRALQAQSLLLPGEWHNDGQRPLDTADKITVCNSSTDNLPGKFSPSPEILIFVKMRKLVCGRGRFFLANDSCENFSVL